MQILTHHPHLGCLVASRFKQRPSLVLVSGKNQDGGKQNGVENGGSPCNLKMTSFAELVRVADRQKVPDPPRKY